MESKFKHSKCSNVYFMSNSKMQMTEILENMVTIFNYEMQIRINLVTVMSQT